MGNCGSTYDKRYCVELSRGSLDADPDIVGPGVLAAFALTALITFGAILIGYCSNSLPEEHLNSLDFAVIDWFSASPTGRFLAYLRSHFAPFVQRCLFMRPTHQREPLTKARREVAFEKFILALSDQQLVTGIAILIAIFANHCRTSIYELNIAISLAWFSSTTHLGTLDVLHRYFRQNIVVRNWRMVGMVGMLILMIPGLVLIQTFVFVTPEIPMQCAQFLPSNTDAGVGPLASTFVIMYLCAGYGSRLYKTFTSEDGSMIDPEWLVWNVLFCIFSKNPRRDRHATIEKTINVCNTRRTLSVEARLDALSEKYSLIRRIGLCIGAYSRSFLQCIAALFFFLSYGISSVVADRWTTYSVNLSEGSNTMEFGQIVPLVLLILPTLAFAEIYYEKPKQETAPFKNEKPEQETVAHKTNSLQSQSTTPQSTPISNNTTPPPLLQPSSPIPLRLHSSATLRDVRPRGHQIATSTPLSPPLPPSDHFHIRHSSLLGITTGILLNISTVGSSGGAILLLIPWAYNIASALRRFTRIAKVLRLISKSTLSVAPSPNPSSSPASESGTHLPDLMASGSWERTTTRQGEVCYVHHGAREARWRVPDGA